MEEAPGHCILLTSPGAWPGLDEAFDQALADLRRAPAPLRILFSGGVDSGLLAWELRRAPDVRLLTLGVQGSHDLAAGRSAASLLGLSWLGLEVDAREVMDVDRRVMPDLQGVSDLERSVQLALALAATKSPPGTLVCGQGIDELFGGYAHSRGLSPGAARARSDADLTKLIERDWPLTRRIAERLGREIRAPFLDARFLSAVKRLPDEVRFSSQVGKGCFRAWAISRGLPPLIARRPKKALQYGSGIDRLLRQVGRPA